MPVLTSVLDLVHKKGLWKPVRWAGTWVSKKDPGGKRGLSSRGGGRGREPGSTICVSIRDEIRTSRIRMAVQSPSLLVCSLKGV